MDFLKQVWYFQFLLTFHYRILIKLFNSQIYSMKIFITLISSQLRDWSRFKRCRCFHCCSRTFLNNSLKVTPSLHFYVFAISISTCSFIYSIHLSSLRNWTFLFFIHYQFTCLPVCLQQYHLHLLNYIFFDPSNFKFQDNHSRFNTLLFILHLKDESFV